MGETRLSRDVSKEGSVPFLPPARETLTLDRFQAVGDCDKYQRELNEQYNGDGAIIYKHACALACEGIVSKRLGSKYRSGRSDDWIKVKNPKAPAVKREAEEDWRR